MIIYAKGYIILKYHGPCVDCNASKNQQYTKKRCIACYQKLQRSNKFEPHVKYEGPCVYCGMMESIDGRFVRKMCATCYHRFKTNGTPILKGKYEGPCIACGNKKSGYVKYFQKKMCAKCYRHYIYVNERPEKEPRYCIDCHKELKLYGWIERCRSCNLKHKWHSDPKYREQRKVSSKQYSKTKRGMETGRAHVRKRRAKLAEVENTLTKEQWQAVLDHFHHQCVYCSSEDSIEMDHVIPISKGGAHVIHNVVPACRRCNAGKNNGPPPFPVQPLLI